MWKIREPDLVIGDPPQTLRWHLFRWRGIQVSLHKWVRSDSDRALHDHSADNISILLNDCYREVIGRWQPMSVTVDGTIHRSTRDMFLAHRLYQTRRLRWPLIPYYRRAETPHRIELFEERPVWTIWIRFKPRRSWGFWCPKGWRHWREFVAERSYAVPGSKSTVGRGCD